MSWQQIAMVVWIVMNVAINLMEDGKLVKRSAIGAIIGALILTILLYTGGFWGR